MAKRKKRAAKSIKSLEIQIAKHEEKKAKSKMPELRRYYEKEIGHLKDELAKKRRIAKR